MKNEKLSPEEIEQRGEAIYAKKIREKTTAADKGKFVVIDVTTGDYEIAEEDITASLRMLEKGYCGDNFYGIRIGHRTAYHLGGYSLSRSQ